MIGQLLVVIPFGIVALNFPNRWGQTPASASISLFRDITWLNLFAFGVVLGWILYLAWIAIIGVATSNSVNLTDGLDGLAAGAGVLVVGAYSVIAFWQFKQPCIGGDPGALGGCYGCATLQPGDHLGLVRREPHRLPVVERPEGEGVHGRRGLDGDRRRRDRDGDPDAHRAAAPRDRGRLRPLVRLGHPAAGVLQGHARQAAVPHEPVPPPLEMRGWSEVTIVVRMWIIAGLLAVSAIGLFYVEWLTRVG